MGAGDELLDERGSEIELAALESIAALEVLLGWSPCLGVVSSRATWVVKAVGY